MTSRTPSIAGLVPVTLALIATALGCATGGGGGTDDPPDAAALIDAAGTPVDASPSAIDASPSATDASPSPIDAAPPMIDAAPLADAPCTLGWVELTQNGDFDMGDVIWAETTNGGSVIRNLTTPWSAHTADYWALFLGFNNGVQTLRQTVSVPATATDLRLRGHRCWVTLETLNNPYDHLDIELRGGGGGALLETLWERDNTHAGSTCNWMPFQLDAGAAYAGQDIDLVFDATSDVSSITSFGMDSLVLEAFACQ